MMSSGIIPSGQLSHNYGKSQFLIGKSTISMAIFDSFLFVYQRVSLHILGIIIAQERGISFLSNPDFSWNEGFISDTAHMFIS